MILSLSRQLPMASSLRSLLACALGAATLASCKTAPTPAPSPAVSAQASREALDGRARLGGADYDVVIRNGRVIDGMGNPWILADVGIIGGKFATIGKITGRGVKEIDAKGLYVSPGWIDMMDQSGGVLPRNGLAQNKLLQGVTTAIGGEGGFPVPASQIPQYFSNLEQQGISINFGNYYSATQARVAVLKSFNRAPTPGELDQMRASMDTAMRAGAMGMTTALIYPPSSYSTTEELVELAKVAARYGGTYASHIRGEGKEVVQSVLELIRIAEEGGLPRGGLPPEGGISPGVGGAHGLRAPSDRGGTRAQRGRGGRSLRLHRWWDRGSRRRFPHGRPTAAATRCASGSPTPAIRARLKREVETGSPGWWNIIEAAGGWEGVVLVNAQNPAKHPVPAEVDCPDREGDGGRSRPMRRGTWCSRGPAA
jgi:N-acyl-D-amino-acid deacylase